MKCEMSDIHSAYCDACNTCHDCMTERFRTDARRIKELTVQVAGLQNELETLRDLLSRSEIDCLGSASEGQIVWPIRDEVIVNISKRLDETPTQSLNTNKAEAIEEAMRLVYHEEDDHRGYYNSEALLNYAKQLRENQ